MTTSFDFYQPIFSATVVTPDGERYPLWTRQHSRFALTTTALSFVSEITIELQLAYLPIIKCTLTPTYREAIEFLDGPLVEWGQSTLEVICGYVGSDGRAVLSQPFRGVLLKPDVQLGADITITLNAQGVGGFGAIRQEANTQFNDATRFEIIEALASRFSLVVDADDVSKSLNAKGEEANEGKRLFKDKIVYAQGGKDYWTAILELVNDAQCHMYLLGNTLKIIPVSKVYASAPVRTFSVFDYPGGKIGPQSGVFPVLSVSSPTSAVYLPGASRGFLVADVSSQSREEIRKFIGDKQVNTPRTNDGASTIVNDQTYPAANEQTGAGAEMFPGNPSDEALVAQVEAEYNAQATLMGVQATVESLGDPLLLPGNTVALRGIGRRISGNYAVHKVTHKIGNSSYTMTMELVSNTSAALANAVKSFGPIAPEPPPSMADDQGKLDVAPRDLG